MDRQLLSKRVLELSSRCVCQASAFRRVVAVALENPLDMGAETSTGVSGFATYGLSAQEEEDVARKLSNGVAIAGSDFPEKCRLQTCYYFHASNSSVFGKLLAPSDRRFLQAIGWQQGDLLVVPYWSSNRIMGYLLLDDPIHGKTPAVSDLNLLGEIAAFGARALANARELEMLSQEHGLLQFLTDYAMTGLLVVSEGHTRYANDQIIGLLGYTREQLSELTPWSNFVHPDDRPLVWAPANVPSDEVTRVRAIRRDGRVLWLDVRIHSVFYKEAGGFAFQFHDVSDRVKTEELLREKALRDPLTGFRNRDYFDDAIQIELQRCKRYKREFTLMMADLANFKLVNDRLGHQEGDRILSGIANVIQGELRESDWVVRYGGDEFLLVLPETGALIENLAGRLSDRVDSWCVDHCQGIPVGIDFGWSTWTTDSGKTIPKLVREADQMMYESKTTRKGRQNRSVSASADSGGSVTR